MNHQPRSLSLCLLTLMGFTIGGCVYRFTNVVMKPPEGIRSIAIEAIYDTSQEVLPHELLWEALHRAFAENGHLRLTSRDKADALLRAHLTTASIGPTGAPDEGNNQKDPEVTPWKKPDPTSFKNLSRAGKWATLEQIVFQVDIEITDLDSRKTIFKSTYSTSGTVKSHRSIDVGQINTHFLLFEEGINSRFKELATSISKKVVSDVMLL